MIDDLPPSSPSGHPRPSPAPSAPPIRSPCSGGGRRGLAAIWWRGVAKKPFHFPSLRFLAPLPRVASASFACRGPGLFSHRPGHRRQSLGFQCGRGALPVEVAQGAGGAHSTELLSPVGAGCAVLNSSANCCLFSFFLRRMLRCAPALASDDFISLISDVFRYSASCF